MLNEFAWQTEEDSSYQGSEVLGCKIGITEDGQYEIVNSSDPSQRQKFSTPEELGEALASSIKAHAGS